MLHISNQFFSGGSVKRIFARVCIGLSRSSKVIDFDENRKRVDSCDFLSVRHSNLGHISPHFRSIAGFLDLTPIPSYFVGVVPIEPDRQC